MMNLQVTRPIGWLLAFVLVRAFTAPSTSASPFQEAPQGDDVRTLYSPPEDGSSGRGSYPRVVQLHHHTAAAGELLATFERAPHLAIYRSTDEGETWQPYSEIEGLRWQPALYELPQQVGEFPAGTVMAAGMSSSADPPSTSLRVHYSTDGGQSWEYLSAIVDGGRMVYDAAQRAGDTRETPVWEPYLNLDASGRLVAYYATERHKEEGYNQALAYKVSEDGGRSWGEQRFMVAVPDGLTRPGMPIVTRLPNGKYFAIYEIVGLPGYLLEPRSNPVFYKVSDDAVDFGDPADIGTLIQDARRQFIWATPWVVWSPYGGPNGTLIAAGRAIMKNEEGQVGNGVMINQNLGEGYWTFLETPIHYTPGPGGYSQTMIPLGDGKEILHLVPVDGEIKYTKFSLPE